jgi:hypothetical protein
MQLIVKPSIGLFESSYASVDPTRKVIFDEKAQISLLLLTTQIVSGCKKSLSSKRGEKSLQFPSSDIRHFFISKKETFIRSFQKPLV